MLQMIAMFLKRLLLEAPVAPTLADVIAHDEAEERTGYYGMNPSPTDWYYDSLDYYDSHLLHPLRMLISWRFATMRAFGRFVLPKKARRFFNPYCRGGIYLPWQETRRCEFEARAARRVIGYPQIEQS